MAIQEADHAGSEVVNHAPWEAVGMLDLQRADSSPTNACAYFCGKHDGPNQLAHISWAPYKKVRRQQGFDSCRTFLGQSQTKQSLVAKKD